MYPSSKKDAARALRQQGKSLNEIVERLGVSKSIVSLWVRKIQLSDAQKEKLRNSGKHAGRIAFAKAAHDRHEHHEKLLRESKKNGIKDTASLTVRDSFMLGLGLYWGEGYKKGSAELGFTNSDPAIITFYIRWLQKSFQIEKGRLIMRVSINEMHMHREKEVLCYWSTVTDTPLPQFTKTIFVKTKQKREYANAKTHYGTLRVKVRGGSVLRARILAALAVVN